MRHVTTIVIGAGQAGLAMSHCLSTLSIDHVLLERGQVANSWHTERWDSLRLLTPNWHCRLPGYRYTGNDPDGFRTIPETIQLLNDYAHEISAPIMPETLVLGVQHQDSGYHILTDQGEWFCRTLVIASGAMNLPNIPAVANELSPCIRSFTPYDYCSPSEIEDGGVLVVGASSSGLQIAHELQRAGRNVLLSVGEHVRVPRTYRGRDIIWMMDVAGLFDDSIDDVDDINRARNLPSMQLVGCPSRATIDLNELQSIGINIVGRLMSICDDEVQFSGGLANVCRLADLKMNRLLRMIDEKLVNSDQLNNLEPRQEFESTHLPTTPLLNIKLSDQGIKTVIWATGFRPDYSWLTLPVFDRLGRLRHTGGVVDAKGVYVMGLPFMRKRKSNLIDGVADDARDLSEHLARFLTSKNNLAA